MINYKLKVIKYLGDFDFTCHLITLCHIDCPKACMAQIEYMASILVFGNCLPQIPNTSSTTNKSR